MGDLMGFNECKMGYNLGIYHLYPAIIGVSDDNGEVIPVTNYD